MTRSVHRRRPGCLAPGAVALVLLVASACAAVPPAAPTVLTPPAPAAEDRRVTPASVRLPSIDVAQGDLLRLGVAADGSAEVPSDFARIGWFDRGPVPGGGGPTVLLGHVDSRSGPAVFHRLRELRAGDPIELGRSDGTTARYVVARVEQVAKDRFPTFAVFGASSDDVLRLVTCAGTFDRGLRSYSDNLVVHAVRA